MARIRTVKPDLFQHEALYEAEIESGLPLRLAFIGLFTQCDREGRFRWRPRVLQLGVLPYDNPEHYNYSAKAEQQQCHGFMDSVLDALVRKKFVVRYEVDGEMYGCIPTWLEHQRPNGREKVSTIPAPSQGEQGSYHAKARQLPCQGTTVTNPCPPGKGNGVREGNKNPPYPPTKIAGGTERDSDIQSLLDLWSLSVKPWTIDDSTAAASDSLRFLLRKTPADFLERAITNFAAFLDSEQREPRYRPNMARWLRDKSWQTYGDPDYRPPETLSDVDQVQAYVDRLDEQTRKRDEQRAEQAIEQGAGS